MATDSADSVHIVADPDAVEALFGIDSGDTLKVFFKEPVSVDEAARKTGHKPNTVYRWVQKWCALGLLEVAATRKKRGRPIKLYRTTAERFFVPFAATPLPTHEALLKTMSDPFYSQFYRSLVKARSDIAPGWGLSCYVDETGAFMRKAFKNAAEPFDFFDPDAPATVSIWTTEMHLTFEEAKRLQEHIYSLWPTQGERPGTRRYLMMLRLAPAAD